MKEKIKIGYQGIEGSNSENAATKIATKMKINNVEFIPLIDSANVVNELKADKIDYGVMAIKNSIAGEVIETKKALKNQNIKLVMKEVLPIHHYLFKKKEIDKEKIKVIASHKQALEQTKNNIRKLFLNIKILETQDTALAAKDLNKGILNSDVAVICTKKAGEIYGLDIVYKNIEDNKENYTTFGLYENNEK